MLRRGAQHGQADCGHAAISSGTGLGGGTWSGLILLRDLCNQRHLASGLLRRKREVNGNACRPLYNPLHVPDG